MSTLVHACLAGGKTGSVCKSALPVSSNHTRWTSSTRPNRREERDGDPKHRHYGVMALAEPLAR